VRAIPIDGAVVVEPMDWSKGTAATQIFTELKRKNIDEGGKPMIDFLMVAGDGREDEVIFRWANELGKSGAVKHVTTVSLGGRNTEATCTLTQGVTGMLPLLLALLFIQGHDTNVRYRCLDGSPKTGSTFLNGVDLQ